MSQLVSKSTILFVLGIPIPALGTKTVIIFVSTEFASKWM